MTDSRQTRDIPSLFQSSTVAVLPYTSSAGSSGIAHLACTYAVPIIASDIPDFNRLAREEELAIDLFPVGDINALAQQLTDLLRNRERQAEMALQNVSAAMRMSMPEIIRQYLQTFELRRDLANMRQLSSLRKLPHWLPMRDALVRRRARRLFPAGVPVNGAASAGMPASDADVLYLETSAPADEQLKTGT